MSGDDEGVTFDKTVGVKETDAALLVRFADGKERWFPKSAIHDDSEVFEEDGEGTLVVKTWFAEKEGLS